MGGNALTRQPSGRRAGSWQLTAPFKVAGNFFIGAMVLNRVLAFVDMRAIGRNSGKALLSEMHVYPQYESVTGSYGLTLQSSF